MRNQETKFGEYFDLPNPGLRAYFSHVVKGNSDEYRTPFYKGKSLESILKGWDPKLKPIQREWPSLFEFEKDLRAKVGPMSIQLPLKERMSDIDSYYDSILLESKPLSQEAFTALFDEWKPQLGGLRLRGQDRTVEIMKKSTNSGNPYFTKRRLCVSRTVPCTIRNMTQYLRNTEWPLCAILGWRGQEGGPEKDDVKQRVVWMFPFALNIRELQFYQPFVEACQKANYVPAWVSMDAVDKEITEMFDSKNPDDLVICTDFSKFDQHFNQSMQDAAQKFISHILTESAESTSWVKDVFPVKFSIPLAYDWDKLRFGAHGMASGSGGTNADETIVHRMMQHEAALAHGSKLNPHSQCLGDDGVITYPGCTVDDVVSVYSSHGQEMNSDKQYASKQDCVYLRRWHHQNYRQGGICVGVYSTYRALGRLAEQERYYDADVWSREMVALRQLSILENVKYHPLREEFVDYCMKGDKYRLGRDIPGFLANIEQKAKEATDYMPDFLGYTKSQQKNAEAGIDNWWIVQYLKSLA